MSLNFNSVEELWEEACEEMIDPPKGICLPWWPKFSNLIGGLRPKELTILCAPTGAGKTQLLASISAQLLLMKTPHFAAPVETGNLDFIARLLSALEQKDLNNGDPVSGELMRDLTKKYRPYLSDNLLISTHDGRVDVQEMTHTLQFMNEEYGCKLAVLDNLNFFLKVTSANNQLLEMDEAIRQLRNAAIAANMHVILVMHPKKTDGGRIESEFDIKGSSTAVQEAMNVILFNRPRDKDIADRSAYPGDREMVFKKLRKRGANINKPIKFGFNQGRYVEL